MNLIGWLACLSAQWVYAGADLPKAVPTNLPPGAPIIQHFTPSDFNAAPQNWDIAQDSRGRMFFANASGLLMFDGTAWKLISKRNELMLRTVAIDEHDVVYVGAMNKQFGYFQSDRQGNWNYESLMEKLDQKDRSFSDIWSIHPTSHGVYFVTYRTVFRWHDNKIEIIPTKTDMQAYPIGDDIVVYTADGSISWLRNGKLSRIYHSDLFSLEKVGRLTVMPYKKNVLLIVTEKVGSYLGCLRSSEQARSDITLHVEKFSTAADAYLSEHGLYLPVA